ncbi:MAG: ferredoxin family protein, partial [Acidobacteriota bacterium]
VSFGWPRRLEMAVAWAFPISLVALLGYPLWGEALVPLWALIWALSLLIFLSFPLYEGQLRIREKRVGWVFFDFGPRGVTLLLGGAFLAVWVAWAFARGDFSWELVARWALASLVVVSILSLDLTGSTPVYKSGLHEDRLLQIALDRERCKGAALCEQVCPTDVLEVDDARRLATLAREERCVQCGACIVQCPFDALYFRTPTGGVVTADTVRTFKLNLLGRRLVRPG